MKWRNGSPLPATYTAAAPALRASVELHIACAAPKGPPDSARCVIGCQRERESQRFRAYMEVPPGFCSGSRIIGSKPFD
jgi:hypothetical protein